MCYLSASFGVSSVFTQIRSNKAPNSSIPFIYIVGLFALALAFDSSWIVLISILLVTLLITSTIYVLYHLPRQSERYFCALVSIVGSYAAFCYLPFEYIICLSTGAVLSAVWFSTRTQRSVPPAAAAKSLLKKRQKMYPPQYPNGWYVVARSEDISYEAGPESVLALGQTLVVYRGETGKVSVLDAYCKHMGANLAQGGRVCGDEIVCPFHEWRFGPDGKCTLIPYAKSIPLNADTKSYIVTEYYGLICIYFDAEGREPEYFPIECPEIDDGRMVERGNMDSRLGMHLLEFCENSADVQHFSVLHGQMKLPFTDIPIPGLTIDHKAAFEPHTNHIIFRDSAFLKFMGRTVPRSGAKAEIRITGPAGLATFTFTTELGKIILFESHTPEGPLDLKVRFRWYAEKSIPRLLVWYVVGNWISQIESDRQVWENKVYMKKPLLVKEDGPIMAVRRYFNRFYSERSKDVGKDIFSW